MADVLVLFAHPMLEKSRVHRALLAAARGVPRVNVRDLYEEYPDFDVDVPAEKALLTAADVVVLQHPFYWYSCPALMKQWIDLVLEHGWAYGRGGTALQGKAMMNAVSSGGGRDAYRHGGYNMRTIREFLFPFEQTARLCKMRYLAPFVVHGTHRAGAEEVEEHARAYARLLGSLAGGALDLAAFEEAAYANELIPAPAGGGN